MLPVPFTPGIREDVRQLAPVGSLARAENVRYEADSIFGRPGTIAVAPTTVGTAHEILNSDQSIGFVSRVGDANLIGLDGEIYARDDIAGTFQFQGIYSTCRPLAQRKGFPASPGRSFGSARSGIVVNNQGYVLACATDVLSTTVYYFIESPAGVRVFYGSETGTKATVVAQGAVFILMVQNGVNVTAIPITIASGAVTTGARTVVGVLPGAGYYWDASGYDTNNWLIVYQSGAALVTMQLYSNVTSSGPKTSSFAVTGICPLSIWGDAANGRAWIGWYNDPTVTGGVKYSGWDISASTWVAYKAATTIFSAVNIYGPPLFGTGETGVGPLWVVQQSLGVTTPFTRATRWGWLDSSGAVEATTFTVYHVTPISKPDARGRVWCITGNESASFRFQRCVLLRFRHTPTASSPVVTYQPTIELALDESVAAILPGNIPSKSYDYFHAIGMSSSAHYYLCPKVLQQGPSTNDLLSVDLVSYVPSEIAPHRRCDEYGLWTTVSGQPVTVFGLGAGTYGNPTSSVHEHESQGAFEIGFAYRPSVMAAAPAGGGNLTALGTYSWCFVYEWTDLLGQRHRSAPSPPYTLTLTGGNQTVNFSLMSLDWHQKMLVSGFFPASIISYRTLAGGTTFFREVAMANSARGTNGVVSYSSGASGLQTDALISASEVLYTDGGVLGNALAPASTFSCRSEERMVVGGGFDARIINFSKIIVPGEPVQFTDSAAFEVVLPEPCTGLAYQDGVYVAFGTRAIYAITGDGPNDQGGGFFSPPRAISRDVGCDDWRSLLETSVGIWFHSERGINLLPRGLGQPQFVGLPIENTSSTYRYCFGAAHFSDEGDRTVRFLMSSSRNLGNLGGQRVMVYDLETNAWGMDTYARGLQAIGCWSAETNLSSQTAGPVLALALLTSTNICAYWEQRNSIRLDAYGGTPETFTSTIETNVLRPWGVAGMGRIRALWLLQSATSNSPSLGVQLYQDGVATSTGAWTPATNAEESYAQLVPAKSQCAGLRIKLTQTTANGFGLATWNAAQISHEPLGERLVDAITERL